jgi:Uma2 family endonuclease
MTTATHKPAPAPLSSGEMEPMRRRFTRDEYYRMADAGILTDQRVELIDGEIIRKKAPQDYRHANAIGKIQEALEALFPRKRFWIRVQMPLDLGEYSEPEPDIAVVEGRPGEMTGHPTTALLVVEIALTSQTFDRTRKASLYAAAGIADYWVLDLLNKRLEIFRNPIADDSSPFHHRYGDQRVLSEHDTVSPLAAPDARLAVSSFL